MNNIKSKILIPALFMCMLLSCRFSQPIVHIRTDQSSSFDSLSQTSLWSKQFKYFTFRKGICLADGVIFKTYNNKGQLMEKKIVKSTRTGIIPSFKWVFIKETTYDSLEQVASIHREIRKDTGHRGFITHNNTVYKRKKTNP